MAMFGVQISIGSRGKADGEGSAPAPAAAAYISRSRLVLDARGEKRTYDYTRTHMHEELVADLGVSLPAAAPAAWKDRQLLWNAVEEVEKRADAQLYRRIMIALPAELTHDENVDLARSIVKERVEGGHIVDAAVHDAVDGHNPHLHMMEPMRATDASGWLPKSRTLYECRLVRRLPDGSVKVNKAESREMTAAQLADARRALAARRKAGGAADETWEKVYTYNVRGGTAALTKPEAEARGLDPTKARARRQARARKVRTVDWDDRDNAEKWRAGWARLINDALAEHEERALAESLGKEREGLTDDERAKARSRAPRVDHRSYERQGVDRAPMAHEGPRVTAIERRRAEDASVAGLMADLLSGVAAAHGGLAVLDLGEAGGAAAGPAGELVAQSIDDAGGAGLYRMELASAAPDSGDGGSMIWASWEPDDAPAVVAAAGAAAGRWSAVAAELRSPATDVRRENAAAAEANAALGRALEYRTAAEAQAARAQEHLWKDDIRMAASVCARAAADLPAFAEMMQSEFGMEVEERGGRLLYRDGEHACYGERLGQAWTRRGIGDAILTAELRRTLFPDDPDGEEAQRYTMYRMRDPASDPRTAHLSDGRVAAMTVARDATGVQATSQIAAEIERFEARAAAAEDWQVFERGSCTAEAAALRDLRDYGAVLGLVVDDIGSTVQEPSPGAERRREPQHEPQRKPARTGVLGRARAAVERLRGARRGAPAPPHAADAEQASEPVPAPVAPAPQPARPGGPPVFAQLPDGGAAIFRTRADLEATWPEFAAGQMPAGATVEELGNIEGDRMFRLDDGHVVSARLVEDIAAPGGLTWYCDEYAKATVPGTTEEDWKLIDSMSLWGYESADDLVADVYGSAEDIGYSEDVDDALTSGAARHEEARLGVRTAPRPARDDVPAAEPDPAPRAPRPGTVRENPPRRGRAR